MKLHPGLMARHSLAVRYQIARHLKTQLGHRRLGAAAAALGENARVPHFRFGLPALVAAYASGRGIRRQMIRVGMEGTVPLSAAEVRAIPIPAARAA
jgi:hypothetical protein